MAVHRSVKKSMRQDKKARSRNRMWKSRMKTARSKLEDALLNNKKDALDSLYKSYVSVVDRAASKGVIHRNNAARKKIRMAQRLSSGQSSE